MFPFVFFLNSRILHLRARLPAYAGDSFVNGPRKTNATFGVACFSFGRITLQHDHFAFADASCAVCDLPYALAASAVLFSDHIHDITA